MIDIRNCYACDGTGLFRGFACGGCEATGVLVYERYGTVYGNMGWRRVNRRMNSIRWHALGRIGTYEPPYGTGRAS